jgi:hypothetical protein
MKSIYEATMQVVVDYKLQKRRSKENTLEGLVKYAKAKIKKEKK